MSNPTKFNQAFILSGLAVAMTMAGSEAYAQVASDAASSRTGVRGIDEIVVTARRREERLQDVPVAISAIDGESIRARGISSTEDLMGAMPNIQISSFVGSATPNITIRGIGVGSEFNASATSPVGVYIDEDYIAFRPAHGVQFYDLERLEVVRGPQGTLYGRNTTGGAVNIISRTPTLGESEGYITAGYGNYSAWNLEGAGEATLIDNMLGVRLAVSGARADGYIKNKSAPGVNLSSDDFAETDSLAARLTVRFQPTESLDFVLKGYWGESEPIGTVPIMKSILPTGGDASGYSRAGLSRDEAEANTQGEMLVKSKGLNLRTTITLSDNASITSITGYNDSLYDVLIDCDGGPSNICGHNLASEQDQFNQDIRVNLSSDRWDAVFGVYYGKEKLRSENDLNYFGFIEDFFPNTFAFNPPIGSPDAIGGGLFNPAAPITAIHAMQGFNQEVQAQAIYGEFTYELFDGLKMTLGGRYTKDEIEYTNALTRLRDENGVVRASVIPFSYPYDPSVGTLSREDETDEVSGRIILDYQFAEDAHVYGSYSRGYRSGAFNGFAYQSVEQIYFAEPEIVDAYEVGLKSRFGDGRYQVNASAFFYDYQDQQVQEVVGAIGFLRSLSGEVLGAEVEAIAQVSDNLVVNASLGLLDTEYDSGQTVSGTDVGGNKWPFAADTTLNIHAEWQFATTQRGTFTLMPEVQYSSAYYYDVFNVGFLKQDAFWLVNGRLTYEDISGFSISLWGKNLTDKYYEPWGANTADFGTNYYVRAKPRTFGIEATYRF